MNNNFDSEYNLGRTTPIASFAEMKGEHAFSPVERSHVKSDEELYDPNFDPYADPADDVSFNKLFLNEAQQLAYNCGARDIFVRGGRGLGKTTFMGARMINCVQSIPRGLGVFLGPSMKSLLGKTGPAIVKSFEQQYGWKEGFQFYRGQPPAKRNWPGPLAKPRTWENAMSFYTGHTIFFISTSQMAAANGLNITELFGDEARFLDFNVIKSDVLPALRGEMYSSPGWNKDKNPLYLSQLFMSDAAVTRKQQQWERERQLIDGDPELVKVKMELADMLAELRICPELAELPQFVNKLNRLRCKARMFFNFSSLENVEVLGEEYIRKMELSMPRTMFLVQILGYELASLGTGGYYSYNEAVHGYMPSGDSQLATINKKMTSRFRTKDLSSGSVIEWEAPDLEETAAHADDCVLDDDLRPDLPLRVAFDVGADFNGCVIGQVDETNRSADYRTLKIIKAMYVKNGPRLETLVQKFCKYYRDHRSRNKELILYTDDTLYQGAAYALEKYDTTRFANVIKKILKQAGWNVHEVNLNRPMLHSRKYQYMSEVFSEQARIRVRINLVQCDFLCAALEKVETEERISAKGIKEIRKKKDTEKYKSEEGIAGPREERSDITDAADTLIIGCGLYNLSGASLIPTSGGIPNGVILSTITLR